MLAGTLDDSWEWHVAHSTFLTRAGCGKLVTPVWQAVQFRTAWTLAWCLAGFTKTLLPETDFRSGWAWQSRQPASGFDARLDCARAEATTKNESAMPNRERRARVRRFRFIYKGAFR